MRGAGCTVNDLWDRDIDKKVARTKMRYQTRALQTHHIVASVLRVSVACSRRSMWRLSVVLAAIGALLQAIGAWSCFAKAGGFVVGGAAWSGEARLFNALRFADLSNFALHTIHLHYHVFGQHSRKKRRGATNDVLRV